MRLPKGRRVASSWLKRALSASPDGAKSGPSDGELFDAASNNESEQPIF